ncbi:response regulator [Fulvivirga imtechensis AK7]|uniref:Response regulator n=1 Tax=Fulvivirga imtechensis AK7 TaxID=1237149 RepID=L8JST2_9BACT|nr:response regulator [Fulvivirga imtechensis]ELR70422.1 response regulator [Fulvivirga imtechensis AK7]
MNVLLIDDDEDTNFLMGILMKKSQVVDLYAIQSNATAALDWLKKEEFKPDCIFVDIQMPDMNGFAFVEVYEKLFVEKFPQTQLFFLSSSAIPEDQEQAKKFRSVQGFITKPLNPKQLQEINVCFHKEPIQPSSPVCFISSDEVRPEYRTPPHKL